MFELLATVMLTSDNQTGFKGKHHPPKKSGLWRDIFYPCEQQNYDQCAYQSFWGCTEDLLPILLISMLSNKSVLYQYYPILTVTEHKSRVCQSALQLTHRLGTFAQPVLTYVCCICSIIVQGWRNAIVTSPIAKCSGARAERRMRPRTRSSLTQVCVQACSFSRFLSSLSSETRLRYTIDWMI